MAGMTLLDVLIAMVIFAFGMLALVQLQGNLGRSMVSGNTQTIASNLAEETIENLRAFERIDTDPDGIESAYADIVDGSFSETRGGQSFDVTLDVSDWYFQPDRVSVSETPVAGKAYSDFKTVEVIVNWSGAAFQTNPDQSDNSRLGSGSISMSAVVPSIPVFSTAQVSLYGNPNFGGIETNYTPGLNPDIVSLQIEDNKFKESTTPEPVVFRADELVESWFDVITYNKTEEGATFLRREEMLGVTCDCELEAPTGGNDGLRPITWRGTEYSEPEYVSKPFGVSASANQSFYCDVCCQDHHDGGSTAGKDLVDPFRASDEYLTSGTFAGDHKHYGRNDSGVLTLAETADAQYVEACRMVRKDGFMHVTQDLRQEAMFALPEDYLVDAGDLTEYSNYVTQAVTAYEGALDDCLAEAGCTSYTAGPPAWLSPDSATPAVVFPASDPDSPSQLPTILGATEQQLRSRGIYVDYLSDELRWVINCMQVEGNTGNDCGAEGATSPLEVIPFFDVQLTKLSRWNENPLATPIDITNETVKTDNTHSRGLASKEPDKAGPSTGDAISQKGNLGLTATDPIDPSYAAKLKHANIYLEAVGGDTPPEIPPGSLLVSGSLASGVSGFKVSGVTLTGIGIACNQTDTTFVCLVGAGAVNPRLSVSGMIKGNSSYYACSSHPLISVLSADLGTTIFDMPTALILGTDTLSGVSILIQTTPCT